MSVRIGTNIISGSGVKPKGRAYFNYDVTSAPVTNTFLTLTNTYLDGITLNSSGNPMLKAGKSYKIMFSIYTCNIPNVSGNSLFMSMTDGTAKTNLAMIYPVATSQTANAQNINSYIGVLNPTSDFDLQIWAVHATNGSVTKGCTALRFNLLIEEI